jgi:hypothetical protein
MTKSTVITNITYNIFADGNNSFVKFVTIRFKNGRTYMYNGVGYKKFIEFLKADSWGTFFNKNIKDKYETTEIVE